MSNNDYIFILSDKTSIEKPSMRLREMASSYFIDGKKQVTIRNVPYYKGIKVIFSQHPQNPYCEECWNSLSYNTRYDENVWENCKYVGKGYCNKCNLGPFYVFTLHE